MWFKQQRLFSKQRIGFLLLIIPYMRKKNHLMRATETYIALISKSQCGKDLCTHFHSFLVLTELLMCIKSTIHMDFCNSGAQTVLSEAKSYYPVHIGGVSIPTEIFSMQILVSQQALNYSDLCQFTVHTQSLLSFLIADLFLPVRWGTALHWFDTAALSGSCNIHPLTTLENISGSAEFNVGGFRAKVAPSYVFPWTKYKIWVLGFAWSS